jgi:periplasmic divalent cation tolerance protein
MEPAPRIVIALVTASDLDSATRIARALVEPGLAACVNLVPGLHSIYRWKGAVEQASEVLLIVKTTHDRIDACRAAVQRAHTYEVPEFIVLEAGAVAPNYAAWLIAETRGADSRPGSGESVSG